MSKRTLTCSCGLEMQVPATALGRKGLCPECGLEILITEENTRVVPTPPGGGLLRRRRQEEAVVNTTSREESWRKFATAVDLFNARRYAESLTLLNTLQQEFPGNPHVETARQQCLDALQATMSDVRQYDGRYVQTDFLNADLVRAVVLDKLLNGATEEVQLQAADVAARLMGIYPPQASPPGMALPEPSQAPSLGFEEQPQAMLLPEPGPTAVETALTADAPASVDTPASPDADISAQTPAAADTPASEEASPAPSAETGKAPPVRGKRAPRKSSKGKKRRR